MNKKVFILLILLIPLLSLQAQAEWGDVNGNGVTNIIDALLTAQYYVGLDVEITELDISVYTRDYSSSDSSKWYNSEAELQAAGIPGQQAARYKEFFDMFREHGDLITNVTFWGIADDNT